MRSEGSKKSAKMLAILLSVLMVFTMMPLTGYAAADSDPEYEFDHTKTAVSQLEDLFTTIDIMDATAAGLSEEMEQGNVTSEQLVQMYLDRIKAYDSKKKLHSVISINPGALEEARALDQERAAGTVRGPLHGIPVIVKDNYDLTGTATTAGSLALAHWTSEKDSFAVQRLREAGAVVIAKANMSEFAYSAINSHSLIGGYVHNPYDLSRSPAGSSGGTGVAITCNFATIGFGTDTGGSIRNPSSWNNLYGIRPSKGLTSIDGVFPLYASRDTVGPMTRTAEDMALALETIAGTDPNDDFTVEADADALAAGGYTQDLSPDALKGKRIGYLKSSFSYVLQPEEDPEPAGEGGGSDGVESNSNDAESVSGDAESINSGVESVNGDALGEGGGGDPSEGKGGDPKATPEPVLPDAKIAQIVKRTRADLSKAGATLVDMSDVLTDEQLMTMITNVELKSPSTIEYDANKYLNSHGSNAPFETLKALLLSGKSGIDYENLDLDPQKLADTFADTKNPYTEDVKGYQRTEAWDSILEHRQTLTEAMEQKNVDAIMFLQELNVPLHDVENIQDVIPQYSAGTNLIGSMYASTMGACIGCPDMVLPMGFSETDASCPVPMPIGMHFIGRFGGEKALMQIAYAYEQQAGPGIRQMPSSTPALKDANLNAYLEALMDEVYSIDYSAFGTKPEGKAKLMEKAYDKAAAVDPSDPYAVYDAAQTLARAYDKTIAALKASGVNLAKADVTLDEAQFSYSGAPITPVPTVKVGGVTLEQDKDYSVTYKDNLNAGTASLLITPASPDFAGSNAASFTITKGKTTFQAKASKNSIKASKLKKKSQTVKIKISNLTAGSSEVRFAIDKVTNGQKSKVKINKNTGSIKIGKNIGKCTIYVKATSKANQNRNAASKTIKIQIK